MIFKFDSRIFKKWKNINISRHSNELIARGYEVYIGKTDKGEVDFVVDNFGKREYIQVAGFLSSDEVIKREFGAFDNIKDNYPKYVITMDKIDYSQNGIIHLNLGDCLLRKNIGY